MSKSCPLVPKICRMRNCKFDHMLGMFSAACLIMKDKRREEYTPVQVQDGKPRTWHTRRPTVSYDASRTPRGQYTSSFPSSAPYLAPGPLSWTQPLQSYHRWTFSTPICAMVRFGQLYLPRPTNNAKRPAVRQAR